MTPVTAHSAIEIAAPIDEVYAHASDFEAMPAWQPDLQIVRCLKRDRTGRAVRVYTELDTTIRLARATLRITYDAPWRVSWEMTDGDVPRFEGAWTFTELAEAETRAEYEVLIDFGRLGSLIRGPAAGRLRDAAVSSMPRRLKAHVEALIDA